LLVVDAAPDAWISLISRRRTGYRAQRAMLILSDAVLGGSVYRAVADGLGLAAVQHD
jgi:hypothetical protein